MNMKGGVGKTTVAMHLGGMIGLGCIPGGPRRVLLIDYDPQFNLSQAWIDPERYATLERANRTTLSILQDDDADLDPFELQVPSSRRAPDPESLVENLYSSEDGHLDIVPATLDLMYIALGEADSPTAVIRHRFADFIEKCRHLYDYTIIDCHPAGSVFTRTSLQNSDHVIIPVVPGNYSSRGVALMLKFIAATGVGNSGPIPHILFNLSSGRPSADVRAIRAHPRLGRHCIRLSLRRYKAFSDPVAGHGFVWYSKRPYSIRAFINLHGVVREIISRIESP